MIYYGKLTRPTIQTAFLDRPRLYHQLDAWSGQRAVLIHAPAGYGKSSLVSRWIELRDSDARTAWLSLDEGDDDPRQFVRHAAAALEHLVPDLLARVLPILDDPWGSPEQAWLRLIEVCYQDLKPAHADREGAHLVLDDLHRVQSPEVRALLSKLLEHGPETLRLLLLARRRTDASLARLYAHGKLSVLSEADLRFTRDEIQQLLSMQGLPAPTDAELDQLAFRSEGWVTALQLAVLSMRQSNDLPQLLYAMQSQSGWLAAFLAEEVLNRQSPEVRRFLLASSLLDAFNGPLCAATTGDNDAYMRLNEVVRAELFLVPLDRDGNWFRYHHLFQKLLQQQLSAQSDAREIAELHKRAAVWLADAGHTEAAVRHFLAAGDGEAAVALVQLRLKRVMIYDPYEARRLLELLPARLLRGNIRLMLDRCFVAALQDHDDLAVLVPQIKEAMAEQGATSADAPDFYAEWLLWQGAVHYYADDLAAAGRCTEQVADYVQHLDDVKIGTWHFLQMHLYRHAGKPHQAKRAAEVALAAFARADFNLGMIAIRRAVARWEMSDGRSRAADRQFAAIIDAADQRHYGVANELFFAHFYAAENKYWQNRLAEAQAFLPPALALARRLDNQDLVHCANLLGKVYASADKPADFQPSERHGPLAQVRSQGVSWLLIDLETRLLLSSAYRSNAPARAEQLALGPHSAPPDHRQRMLIPYLRVCLALGYDLEDLTQLLADGLAQRIEVGNRFEQLQLLALSAWQQLQLGQEQAAATLAQAVRLADETGYVRVLYEIPEVAQALAESGMELAEKRPPERGIPAPQDVAVALTEQEESVLKLLAADFTYQHIAESLVISINTVRTHVRHIYKKLGVKRREQAVHAARQRGLLLDSAGLEPAGHASE